MMDQSDRDALLIRLDERTQLLEQEVSDIKRNQEKYVTIDVHQPVARIVYGVGLLVVGGFITAIVTLIGKSSN